MGDLVCGMVSRAILAIGKHLWRILVRPFAPDSVLSAWRGMMYTRDGGRQWKMLWI
jgi:hypothetical protein